MNCRVCLSSNIHQIFSFPPIPLVGEFTAQANPNADLFPITVVFCENCKVLLIAEKIDSNRLFREYSFSSSTVPGLVKHFESYAKWIFLKYGPKKLLEIGCNDGVLLNPLKKLGVEVFGVDISENISEIAISKGLNVKALKFDENSLNEIKAWCGEVDFLTASNTFPHNEDPNGFLLAANHILSSKGRIALEVMYSGSLQESIQWDTIYHEHLHFHSLTSLKNLLSNHGFFLEYAEIVPMHAGSLRVVASRSKSVNTPEVDRLLELEESSNLNSLIKWQEFASNVNKVIEATRRNLLERSGEGKVWAYGASGRATMWIKVANLDFIEKVVDSSPLRAGHFMPGTSIPIVSPTNLENNYSMDTLFITAWNYADAIVAQHPNFLGTWVVPLPEYKEFKRRRND